jgi:hypothetical protein
MNVFPNFRSNLVIGHSVNGFDRKDVFFHPIVLKPKRFNLSTAAQYFL